MYIGEVVLAFEYLHTRNVVYRDLKVGTHSCPVGEQSPCMSALSMCTYLVCQYLA